MTEQIITITGLEFTTEGRPIAHGVIIREGAGTLEETMKAGGAQMGTPTPDGWLPNGSCRGQICRTGGRSSVLRGTISAGGRG
ncbi:MAG: hypothetical protein ACLTY5_08255 [Angelakisella sp.]